MYIETQRHDRYDDIRRFTWDLVLARCRLLAAKFFVSMRVCIYVLFTVKSHHLCSVSIETTAFACCVLLHAKTLPYKSRAGTGENGGGGGNVSTLAIVSHSGSNVS